LNEILNVCRRINVKVKQRLLMQIDDCADGTETLWWRCQKRQFYVKAQPQGHEEQLVWKETLSDKQQIHVGTAVY